MSDKLHEVVETKSGLRILSVNGAPLRRATRVEIALSAQLAQLQERVRVMNDDRLLGVARIGSLEERVGELEVDNERMVAAITEYIGYWGRGGACQNLTIALLPDRSKSDAK